MIHEWKEGMRVKTRQHPVLTGVIHYIDDPEYIDEVEVQWDDNEKYPVPQWEQTRFLIPEDPKAEEMEKEAALLVQAKIDEATHSLEAAFRLWQEAQDLHGSMNPSEFMQDPSLDTRAFANAIESNGWSSSSLYC